MPITASKGVAYVLQGLIRINTVNTDPAEGEKRIRGNELEAARFVEDYLSRFGIKSEIIEHTPGRASIVARLKAGRPSGKAVAFMAHSDVVSVSPRYWKLSEPFSGEIKDGFLYGRGAIDDKGMAACIIEALIRLKQSGAPLKRDVVFIMEADEEAGGHIGIEDLVSKRPDIFRDVEFVINEGGNIIKAGGAYFLHVQIAEKTMFNVRLVAKGEPGHSSLPHSKNPVAILAQAIARLESFHDIPRLHDITRNFLSKRLGLIQDSSLRGVVSEILSSSGNDYISACNKLRGFDSKEALYYNAAVRNTATPTVLRAGASPNVIPPEAEAIVNVRMLPGSSPEEFMARLRSLFHDLPIEANVEGELPPAENAVSSVGTACHKAIVDSARSIWGEKVVPMDLFSSGATDSRFLRRLGIHCYGILPFPLTEEDWGRMHGNDERVEVAELEKGVDFLFKIMIALSA